ncbi:Hypothetical protein DEACI_1107 [Acididesulfobacillus acetoxydans]|uniref:Uncharacterized protein n=1 Tax=Acididesulfobacillus acetoxydans TaxID=1561005 RepID=A0A8S0WM87_9FIRM|nr:hypothetical protein [Acididesulfobacillus acetoxydans]CAA7600454.1 Hypothetical protein DEACI_1107 [Acididesulfobacillus acetoxydans]CEJ06588.1 Hypothetical protein DEACI_1037 [Acididesulfobacillus acetoxydans]
MLDFIRKSPLGFILTATALVLVASPKAREAARNWLVKGTATILDLVDESKAPATTRAAGQTNVYEMGAYPSKAEPTAAQASPNPVHPAPSRPDPGNISPS